MFARVSTDRRLIKGVLVTLLLVVEIAYGAMVATLGDAQLALVMAVGLVAIVVTFIEPVWGLGLFVIAMFAEALLGVEGGPTGARLLGIMVLGAWAARSLSSGHFRILLPRSSLFALAYVVWGLGSILWAIDLQVALERAQIIVQSVVLYILVINLVNSRKRVQSILSIMAFVSLVVALLTIFRLVSGQVTGGRVAITQVSGYGPNDQAALLFPGTTLLMALFNREERFGRKLLFLFALSTTVLAILATSSRGALVSLFVVVAAGLIVDRSTWQVVLLCLLIGGAASFLLPSTFSERVLSIVTLSDRAAGRLDIWQVGLQIIHAHPMFGVGWGNFGKAFDRYLSTTPDIAPFIGRERGPHNIFFGVLGELGIIGFVPFVLMIGSSVKSALTALLRFKRRNDSTMTSLAMSVFLSLLGVLTASLFIDLRFRKYFWLSLALAETMRHLPPGSDERARVKVRGPEERI